MFQCIRESARVAIIFSRKVDAIFSGTTLKGTACERWRKCCNGLSHKAFAESGSGLTLIKLDSNGISHFKIAGKLHSGTELLVAFVEADINEPRE